MYETFFFISSNTLSELLFYLAAWYLLCFVPSKTQNVIKEPMCIFKEYDLMLTFKNGSSFAKITNKLLKNIAILRQ